MTGRLRLIARAAGYPGTTFATCIGSLRLASHSLAADRIEACCREAKRHG